MSVRLDHVVFHVSDWDRADDFYREVLGAEVIGHDGPRRYYRLGDQQLNVHGPATNAQPVARNPGVPGSADLCFAWDGPIDEAIEHLQSHGVEIEEGPVPRFGGRGNGTSVYFRDPDGSLLEFISYT